MLDAPPQPPRVRGRRGTALRLAIASALALVLLASAASAAQAEPTVGNATLTCQKIIVTFSGFPNAPNNTVKEQVRIDGVQKAVTKTFVFNGPEATDEILISLPPGEHAIDLFSKFKNSNGVSGGRDQFLGKITCTTVDPELEIDKSQKYSTKKSYTKELLKLGHVGNVVDYQITVRNTGNVPLTIEFSDPHCDPGTITGGPSGPLLRFESTTYFCTHTIIAADQEAGIYCNTAEATGTPTEGSTVQKQSNTVCVEVPNPHNEVEFGCKVVKDYLIGFPNTTNTVKIRVRVDGVIVLETAFKFTGSSAVFSYELNLPPGHHGIDVYTHWETNGFRGGTDIHAQLGVRCAAEPGFSIEKLQTIEGSAQPFTTSQLEADAGQTVDYEIVITNTGNTPLTFGPLNDPKCDPGTIEGGPGNASVEPAGPSKSAGKTTFTCKHTLTAQDEVAGEYANAASATGTPPPEEGEPVTNESNTVVVKVREIV